MLHFTVTFCKNNNSNYDDCVIQEFILRCCDPANCPQIFTRFFFSVLFFLSEFFWLILLFKAFLSTLMRHFAWNVFFLVGVRRSYLSSCRWSVVEHRAGEGCRTILTKLKTQRTSKASRFSFTNKEKRASRARGPLSSTEDLSLCRRSLTFFGFTFHVLGAAFHREEPKQRNWSKKKMSRIFRNEKFLFSESVKLLVFFSLLAIYRRWIFTFFGTALLSVWM